MWPARVTSRLVAQGQVRWRSTHQEEAYNDYLSNVSSSLKATAETTKFRRANLIDQYGQDVALTQREEQGAKIRAQIKETLVSTDEAVLKLKKVNRLFFRAEDSSLPIIQVIPSICAYLMSFTPFPEREVGFQRHEMILKLYDHQKRAHNGAISTEVATVTLEALGKTLSTGSVSHYFKAKEILQDMRNSKIVIPATAYGSYFNIAGRVEKTKANDRFMLEALAVHEEYFKSVDFVPAHMYYLALLRGLLRQDLITEALHVINGFNGLTISNSLASLCISVCARSKDPLSAFSMYKVIYDPLVTTLKPSVRDFSGLLGAAARDPEGMKASNVQFVASEMATHGVHTSAPGFLNRLCISFFAVKRPELGLELIRNMRARDIKVWQMTEASIPMEHQAAAQPTILGTAIKRHRPAASVQQAEDTGADLTTVFSTGEPMESAPTWVEEFETRGLQKATLDARHTDSVDQLPESAPVFYTGAEDEDRTRVRHVREVKGLAVSKAQATRTRDAQEKRTVGAAERGAEKARHALRSLGDPTEEDNEDDDGKGGSGYDVAALLGL
eukprot:Rhum_TRINITY_DN285_c0_g1::Rhum_TRINITY_DN285_c0_g1_i1::g.1003::m.1003